LVKVKPALPFAPDETPVSEVSVSVVGFSFAVPALPDHLVARLPDVENGPPEKAAAHLLVPIDHEPLALPLKIGEVTLLPEALHPESTSLAFTITDAPPMTVRPGENLSFPVTELHETFPVAFTGSG
jgi:hypothetical protein